MNRRKFLFRTGPTSIVTAAVGFAVSGQSVLADTSIVQNVEDIVVAMKNGPVAVVIDDGGDISERQVATLATFMRENPDFAMPVFSIPPGHEDFSGAPGTLLIMDNGFVEASRSDLVPIDDMMFVFEAVMINEGGKG